LPVITEDAIRELASFRGNEAPVTTCYLDVDGRRLLRQQDVEQELDQLLRRAKDRGDMTASHADLNRIEEFVRRGFDRSRTRGLAIFSCAAHALWHVVHLPVQVRSQLVINELPAVGQLETLVQTYERFGVLLVDRKRARMFLFQLGELVDRSELFDQLPRDYDERGQMERGGIGAHVDELSAQHARRAAAVAFHVHQNRGFDRLTIGGSDDVVRQVERALHPYLTAKLCSRVPVAPTASTDEILAAAIELEARVEREKEAVVVAALRDASATGKGVHGLAPTLGALNERRVERLVISSGFSEPGWRCTCGAVLAKGPLCPTCRGEMRPTDDVVEDAIEVALAQGGAVELCVDNADLDVLGRIGAFLRY
jgi:peptide chain release factor subunit 1